MPNAALLGVSEFRAAIDRWSAMAEHATEAAVIEAGRVVKEAAAARINNVSGDLAASIKTVGPERVGFASYTLQVGPTAIYTRKVEMGKHNPHGALAHPFFGPGFEEAATQFPALFRDAWAEAQRGV